jgi:hypothetical protein
VFEPDCRMPEGFRRSVPEGCSSRSVRAVDFGSVVDVEDVDGAVVFVDPVDDPVGSAAGSVTASGPNSGSGGGNRLVARSARKSLSAANEIWGAKRGANAGRRRAT